MVGDKGDKFFYGEREREKEKERVVSAGKAANSMSGRGQYLCHEFFEISLGFLFHKNFCRFLFAT